MSHKTLCGAIQSKFWGNTQCIFVGPISETHFLNINKGGYCSNHCHKYKWNRFFLISGGLTIKIERNNGVDITHLKPGQFTDVPPGVYHEFECTEDAQCLEIYWVDSLDPTDINRKNFGGADVNERESDKMKKIVEESP